MGRTIRTKADSAQEESLPVNLPMEAIPGDGLPSGREPERLEGEPAPLSEAEVEEIVSEPSVENTDPSRSANENVEAGGHPTGSVPGGYT